MWIVHHFLRVIWANILGFFYNIYYLLLITFSKESRNKYKYNIKCWEEIQNISRLADYIRNNYKYKYDGYKGIVDHNNFKYEFFTASGDCDDVARWVCKKLRELDIKADVIGFSDFKSDPVFWHYDCLFCISDTYFLFNYGHCNIIKYPANNETICNEMMKIYQNTYKFKNLICWICKYM